MQNKTKSKEGFRTYRKKMAAILLVGMLAVSTAVTGCGKKDIDYDVEGMVVPEAMRTVAACRVNMEYLKAVIPRSQQEIPVFRRLQSMQKK